MPGHQPKELTELAFESFTAYMKNEALQLLNWMEDSPTSTIEATEKLKDFFHGTRLPTVLTNEITKRLLYKLDMFSIIYKSMRKDYFQQILMTLVEVFMHPDVTSIELGPSYLKDTDDDYFKFVLKIILMKVGHLHNLKTLSVEFRMCYVDLKDVKLVLPSNLKELTLCRTFFLNDDMESIVECCRELKSFKIMRSNFDDIIVPHLRKLNHIETLHLLGENGFLFEEDCVALINDVLSASGLKSFGTFLRDENLLHLIVDKLPHLTEIVLQLENEIDLSCLTELKNLRSLTLDCERRISDEYKKILPVLGKSLVSLDLQIYKRLDLEFIGETCSNLRCLHVNATSWLAAGLRKPAASLKSFPNFRTVECLKLLMYARYGWIEFLIAQCVNVKVLSVIHILGSDIIGNVLKRTSLARLEEIHAFPEISIENSCLEELCMKSPNLRLIHGLDPYSTITGFSFHECHKFFCEFYCYAGNEINMF